MRTAPPTRWPARLERRQRPLPRAPRALRGAAASPATAQPQRAITPPLSAAAERGRQQVVALVFLIYLLVIFEGSLRKWVLPQFNQYVFFIRDPVLIVAYAIAMRHGLWPRGQALFTASLWLAGAGLLLAAVQAATDPHSDLRLILGVYGWRAYFLYVPLAFLVGAVFRPADVLRLCKLTLLLAVPIAVLVTAQFFSSPGAAINVGNAAEEELQFRGLAQTGERTRPMGPFSSGAGQQQFTATACAIALAFFIAPRRIRQPSFVLLALGAGGVLTAAALSGSRGTVLQCGLSLLFALGLAVLGRGGAVKGRALLWPVALVLAALLLGPLLLTEGFAAFTERWLVADAAERKGFEWGVFGRAFFGLIDFVRLMGDVPLLGYGLGYGGNASITLGASIDGVKPGWLAETDFARHMVDLGPLFGMGYIVFRLVLAAWLTVRVWRATRRSSDPLPMLLLSYVAYVVVMGQITAQGAINLYGWLFAGLLIAACRHATEHTRQPCTLSSPRPPQWPLQSRTSQ